MDGLSWSNTITEGIVLLSPDWQIDTQNTGYRFSTMGSNRLVSLSILIRPNKQTTDGVNSQALIRIPQIIQPSHALVGMADAYTEWALYSGCDFEFRRIAIDKPAFETWTTLTVNATYVI